jgi:hypothetical protein
VTELGSFQRYIFSTIDHLIEALAPLTADEVNWRPAIADANSLYAIATHVLGNTEENVFEVLCGGSVGRNRAAEFVAAAQTTGELTRRWSDLRGRIGDALEKLPPGELDRVRSHPRRGTVMGRDVLIVVARHAAEHWGEAQLTLNLLRARDRQR